jgi:hypothetical protein
LKKERPVPCLKVSLKCGEYKREIWICGDGVEGRSGPDRDRNECANRQEWPDTAAMMI